MPDSYLPPGWGPPPFDERDLDALLSGETADIPFALRHVADALTALRAAPTQAELSGEAVIMAEFSAVTEFSASGLSEQLARDVVEAHTLVLSAPQAVPSDVARRRGARHRGGGRASRPSSPRPHGRPLSRRAGVIVGGAVAALIVATAAVAANLHGSLHGHSASTAAASAAPQTGPLSSGSQSVAARSASAVPTGSPSPSHDAAPAQSQPQDKSAKKLCRTLFGYFKHPELRKAAAESALLGQVSKLAGGPDKVVGYCEPYIKNMFPHGLADADGQPQGQANSDPGSKSGPGNGGPPQPVKSASPMQRP